MGNFGTSSLELLGRVVALLDMEEVVVNDRRPSRGLSAHHNPYTHADFYLLTANSPG
jgi:hypothetical protein